MAGCDPFVEEDLCGSDDGCNLRCGDSVNFLVGLCKEDQDCVDLQNTGQAIVIAIVSCIVLCCLVCTCAIIFFCYSQAAASNNQPVVALAHHPALNKELPK